MTSLVCAAANYAEARLLAEVYEWADRAYEIAPTLVIVGEHD